MFFNFENLQRFGKEMWKFEFECSRTLRDESQSWKIRNLQSGVERNARTSKEEENKLPPLESTLPRVRMFSLKTALTLRMLFVW